MVSREAAFWWWRRGSRADGELAGAAACSPGAGLCPALGFCPEGPWRLARPGRPQAVAQRPQALDEGGAAPDAGRPPPPAAPAPVGSGGVADGGVLAAGPSLGVGEGAELAGPVVADRVDPDDLA